MTDTLIEILEGIKELAIHAEAYPAKSTECQWRLLIAAEQINTVGSYLMAEQQRLKEVFNENSREM